MFEVINTIPAVSLQGLPLIFKVKSDRAETYFRITAQVVTDYSEIASRDADNIATFELRDYFATKLYADLQLTGNIKHANACKSFTVNFYEFYGNPPSAHANDVISKTFLLCMGTVPEWKKLSFDLKNNTFVNYLETTRVLSWFPLSVAKKVLTDQVELMYILWPNLSFQDIDITATFTDGTTQSKSIEHLAMQVFEVASFSVGYEALSIGTMNVDKTVQSYTVSIAGQVRNFIVDHSPHYNKLYLIFRNSLGGFDTLACTGERDEFTEVERKISKRVYSVDKSLQLSKSEFYNEHTEHVKVSTGWLTKEEKNWLNDLLISKEVYEIRGSKLQRVLISNKSIDRSWRFYEPGSIEIEFERINYVI